MQDFDKITMFACNDCFVYSQSPAYGMRTIEDWEFIQESLDELFDGRNCRLERSAVAFEQHLAPANCDICGVHSGLKHALDFYVPVE